MHFEKERKEGQIITLFSYFENLYIINNYFRVRARELCELCIRQYKCRQINNIMYIEK